MEDIYIYTYVYYILHKKIVKQVMLTSKFRYTEIILGPEWLPGLLDDEGAAVRAELGKMTGQTSMPLGEPLGGGLKMGCWFTVFFSGPKKKDRGAQISTSNRS